MADAPEFIVDNAETAISDDQQFVRLRFSRDSGERREVTLRREWLPQLITALQRRIEPGQAVPIGKSSLHPGQTIALQGFEVKHAQDASILTLFVDVENQNRVVTLPIELPPASVKRLINMLTSD